MISKKMVKQALLEELYKPYKNCQLCPLWTGRTSVVFGEGNPDAPLFFVGEAPGKEEDLTGRPFVGRSGLLLRSLLEKAGLAPEDYYISNTVKCRPPGNRTPLPAEITTCTSLLLNKQIALIKPALICSIGATPTTFLSVKKEPISRIRGTIVESKYGMPLLPMYHPAYILRSPQKLPFLENDLMVAKKYLNSIKDLKNKTAFK